ncbi:MAG: radical SAM protein [Cloacibacillus sp.]
MAEGLIFNIARYAVHDGPGIRTTVFLKGCPMRCLWCCSPQSQSFEIEKSKSGKVFGSVVSADELFSKVSRDAPFWRRSGGGITLSGGEVFSQPEFAAEFLDICRAHYVHTAIESCLCAPLADLKRVAQKADLIQLDIKAMDPSLHKKLTGFDNEGILSGAEYILKSDAAALLRFPLVPGCNDAKEELERLGAFAAAARPGASVEILRYHRLGVGLYEELGRNYALADTLPPSDAQYNDAVTILKKYDLNIIEQK